MAQKKKGRKPSPKRSAVRKPAGRPNAAKPAAARQKAAKRKATKRKAAKPKAAKPQAAKGKAVRRKGASTNRTARPSARPAAARGGRRGSDPVAEIQRVIDVMVAAGAVEVELEEAGTKLRVRLKSDVPVSVVPYATPGPAPGVASAVPASAPDTGSGGPAQPGYDDPKRTVFKSPMVGTFYRAAAPDSDPYVEVGDRFGPDTTLCILEAMKVMNEIKAETSGEVVEILAQNGEPVEFGQPLLVIRVD